MTYLEQYDAAEGQPQAQVALVSRWLRTEWRPFFAELRARRPVLRTPAFTLLSRFDDVTEALSREQDFSVRLYAPKMDAVVNGPFMLARDDTPINWREKGIMQAMLRPEDLPQVRALAGKLADEALDAAMPEGRIEIVERLGRYVPIRICGEYFGFPGPDLQSMYRWSRATQSDMFKNLQNDPAVHQAAVRAGEEMRAYLAQLLEEKRASLGGSRRHAIARVVLELRDRLAGHTGHGAPLARRALERIAGLLEVEGERRPEPQDTFARLVRTRFPAEIGFDDQRILANMAGLLIGAGETTSQAIVQALRQILLRDDVHAQATAAAAESDPTKFDAYVWEALRLDPINPLLFRLTARDSIVAAGTARETRIPAGTIVFALTASAMSDENRVPEPDGFRTDRPEFLALHFGYGHHACLGRYVGAMVIPEVIRRILLRPGVRLLPSPAGDVDFKGGPFPERFVIGLDGAGSRGRATEERVAHAGRAQGSS